MWISKGVIGKIAFGKIGFKREFLFWELSELQNEFQNQRALWLHVPFILVMRNEIYVEKKSLLINNGILFL